MIRDVQLLNIMLHKENQYFTREQTVEEVQENQYLSTNKTEEVRQAGTRSVEIILL
jgi:DNA-binding response OmpR family regulator